MRIYHSNTLYVVLGDEVAQGLSVSPNGIGATFTASGGTSLTAGGGECTGGGTSVVCIGTVPRTIWLYLEDGPDSLTLNRGLRPPVVAHLGPGNDTFSNTGKVVEAVIRGSTVPAAGEIDRVDLSARADAITATIGQHGTIDGSNIQLVHFNRLTGGAGADTLSGYSVSGVTLDGGPGDDWLAGGSGGDSLNGDADADTIHAGEGIDAVSGGAGPDTLYTVDRVAEPVDCGGDADSFSSDLTRSADRVRDGRRPSGGCRVGELRYRHSPKVVRGRVIRIRAKPGAVLAPSAPVDIVISRGKR